mmetsp:Transcript_11929/g.21834  ORF Transcript_11929/g.21834 Transcript_11929/m.21834 type:complete len:226 (+) Transcript_11929:884-1561(+)
MQRRQMEAGSPSASTVTIGQTCLTSFQRAALHSERPRAHSPAGFWLLSWRQRTELTMCRSPLWVPRVTRRGFPRLLIHVLTWMLALRSVQMSLCPCSDQRGGSFQHRPQDPLKLLQDSLADVRPQIVRGPLAEGDRQLIAASAVRSHTKQASHSRRIHVQASLGGSGMEPSAPAMLSPKDLWARQAPPRARRRSLRGLLRRVPRAGSAHTDATSCYRATGRCRSI